MRQRISRVAVVIAISSIALAARGQTSGKPASENAASVKAVARAFAVKYVAQDTVYLTGGRGAGLAEGQKLIIRRIANVSTAGSTGEGTNAEIVAELQVIAVADTSAVCSVQNVQGEIHAGDFAYFTEEQAEMLVQQQALGEGRRYPQVVTFTDGDPLEEEIREQVPRPPLPEVNRIRGRFGFDYSTIVGTGSSAATSSQTGVVFRADMTRIGGSYWNLSGYWRGRINSSAGAQQSSLQDLINRTYHLNLTYDNPNSRWVAGFGRLYVPWASSLETIDGGYGGRKLGHATTVGLFAGTTPDPTSWSYAPDQRIGGGFINFEGGSFDQLHYTTTSGFGLSMTKWNIDRPFAFFENSVSYKRLISIYESLQADNPKDVTGLTRVGTGVSRSFVTFRLQPNQRFSFDVNHNYMRDVPTFDPRLIGTGLLDKYLFQGFSVGARVETWRRLSFYTNVGHSNRSGDAKASWNTLYGVTVPKLWRTGIRTDLRYSQFHSSFGQGHYEALSFSRSLRDGMRFEAQFGRQSLTSQFSSVGGSRFVNLNADLNIGPRYFLQTGFTNERGGTMPYNQYSVTFGYRFDNHATGRSQ